MITVRKSEARGAANHGWLDTKHSFSFGDYLDRTQMNFRSLRVLNEDIVAPEMGFPLHPHKNAEILTYIVSGELTHTDSLGHREIIKRGDVQYTNAGSGIEHSEINQHSSEAVHLLQIWILPKDQNTTPAYSYLHFDEEQKKNALCLIATSKEIENTVRLNQSAEIFASILEKGNSLTQTIPNSWGAWLQLISGSVSVNGTELEKGDAAKIEQVLEIKIEAKENSEFLLFNLE